MGWVSATQYEPEFWGKLPPPPVPFQPAPQVVKPKVEEQVVEPQVEEPKAEPKVVDTAPAVKRVAKKTTPEGNGKL